MLSRSGAVRYPLFCLPSRLSGCPSGDHTTREPPSSSSSRPSPGGVLMPRNRQRRVCSVMLASPGAIAEVGCAPGPGQLPAEVARGWHHPRQTPPSHAMAADADSKGVKTRPLSPSVRTDGVQTGCKNGMGAWRGRGAGVSQGSCCGACDLLLRRWLHCIADGSRQGRVALRRARTTAARLQALPPLPGGG